MIRSVFFRRSLALLMTMFVLLAMWPMQDALAQQVPEVTLPPFGENVPVYSEDNPGALVPEQLYAEACILINQDNGQVLFEKNADVQMNPASCTKIMTLLLAIEHGNLYEMVRIPEEAAQIPEDSSKIPVTVGEEMTFLDLLYGFMLRSGNDGSNAIAVIVSGSVDAFVARMNQRAQELGLTNTQFKNAHGYTAEGHYTTARDMAKLTQYAMQYDVFRKIVSTGQYTMSASNLRDEYVIENSNEMVIYGAKNRYRYATGVKTGTTSAAGQCLVTSATKDGINLIGVCFKSTVVHQQAKYQDSRRLLEYGFSRYRTYSFLELYELLTMTLPISNAAADDPSGGVVGLTAMPNRSVSYSVTIFDNDMETALAQFQNNLKIDYSHNLEAPIEQGTVLGNLTYTTPEGDLFTAVLVADRAVAARPSVFIGGLPSLSELFASIPLWLKVVIGFVLLFVLILLLASAYERRRRKRLRKLREMQRRRAMQQQQQRRRRY